MATSFIKWLTDLNKDSGPIAGGKGANLAEMFNAKMPVPPAFVVTTNAYFEFIEKTKIKDEIYKILDSINVDDTADLTEKSKKIREIMINAKMPKNISSQILEAYEHISVNKEALKGASQDALSILKNSQEPIFVAVRSSATTEDLADSSFAGQQETYLNVKGDHQLIKTVKKVLASLFTARAIYYRKKRGFANEKFALAAVVQKMVDSEKAGVMFSKNPVKNDDSILVEAVFGLGEGIVSGKINPDTYEISRELKIISKKIGEKKIAITRNSSGETTQVKLTPTKSKEEVLEDNEIIALANHALKIEEHYENKPQDIEFAIENNEIFITQSRPITTKHKESNEEITGNEILSGLGASPGVGSGKVKIINDISELSKVSDGDILVTKMTNPDMVVSMQKAAGIITDEGGITSHAAIVSREMGIPAIVGTGKATEVLKEGQGITMDGRSGKIYTGETESKKVEILPIVPTTKTKIKVIVDIPDAAERAALTKCDSVGLLRLEGIISTGKKHPLKYIKDKTISEYEKLIETEVNKILEKFKEVWIRTSDIRSDEFENLEGAPKKEGNPMLGMHGIRFSLKHPEILKAEFQAVKNLSEKNPDKIIGIMMPQIISVEEVEEAKKIAESIDLLKKQNVKLGIMVETPAAASIIKNLLKTGIKFISFGTNDLTQYTLAIDRNNPEVQDLFDETHPAVLNSIKRVLRTCQEFKVESSICGQAGSKKPMAKFLVENGINSISVNADAAAEISKYVAELESSALESSALESKTPEGKAKELGNKVKRELAAEVMSSPAPEKAPETIQNKQIQPQKSEIVKEEKHEEIPTYVESIIDALDNIKSTVSDQEALSRLFGTDLPINKESEEDEISKLF